MEKYHINNVHGFPFEYGVALKSDNYNTLVQGMTKHSRLDNGCQLVNGFNLESHGKSNDTPG